MRYIVLVVALFFAVGCEYEYNYYGFSDGGAVEAATDSEGGAVEAAPDSEGDDMGSIWTSDSKIFGNATLTLQPAPNPQVPAIGAFPLWPFIRDTPAMNGSQTVLDLSTIDGQPHIASLSFALTSTRPPVGPFAPSDEVVAVFNLGIGGILTPVEVDVVQGTTFSLPVNRLQVHLVYRSVPNTFPITPMPTYTVGASVATGVVAHGRQPQRTLTKSTDIFGAPALAVGGGDFWNVPAFAKSFRVVANPSNANLLVSLLPVMGGALFLATYPTVAYPTVDLVIPSGSYYVFVQNTGAAVVGQYSLVFDLAL